MYVSQRAAANGWEPGEPEVSTFEAATEGRRELEPSPKGRRAALTLASLHLGRYSGPTS